jgi:hypothetical protein
MHEAKWLTQGFVKAAAVMEGGAFIRSQVSGGGGCRIRTPSHRSHCGSHAIFNLREGL